MKIIFHVCLFLILVFIDFWLLEGVNKDKFIIFRYMNYFGYYLVLIGVLISGSLIYLNRTNLFLVGLVFLLLIPVVVTLYKIPPVYFKFDKNDELDLASNLTYISFSKMSRNDDYHKVLKLLDCETYHIIAMQEATGLSEYLKKNPGATKCYYSFNDSSNLAVFSKYPVAKTDARKSFLAVFEVHYKQDLVLNVVNLRMAKVFSDREYAVKSHQVELLRSIVDGLEGPVIVGGDFNDTPFNYSVWHVKTYMNYSRPEGILTQSFTFPAEGRRLGWLGPIIRIDHVFSKGLSISSVEVLSDSFGSDHYPVKCIFQIP